MPRSMPQPTTTTTEPTSPLILVRHGATGPNLAGLRCGGDLDVPLTGVGRDQARQAALRLRALEVPVGVILTSDLQRTRETAEIIRQVLGRLVEIVVEPAFSERRLGSWNLRSAAETERALLARETPPGGEADAAFLERIARATRGQLVPRLAQRPLLVASKGVARALGEFLGVRDLPPLGNGEWHRFDLVHAPLKADSCHA